MQEKHAKALGSPQGASTPTGNWKVQSRPSTRGYVESKESIPSPIPKCGDETEDDDDDDDMGDEELHSAQSNSTSPVNNPSGGSNDVKNYSKQVPPTLHSNQAKLQNKNTVWMAIIFVVFSVVLAVYSLHYSVPEQKLCSVKHISKDFPTGTKDFWLSIGTALNDINKFNKPKTIIFLYEHKYSTYLNKLLDNLSNMSKCCIALCDSSPIQLKASDLSSGDVIRDYGKLITLYTERLRNSGVMIVRNLDEVPGKVAQAFHTFCDEYNPLVEKALFLFTVEVSTYPRNKLKYLEERLKGKWGDLSEETFYPLFTRITDLVLEIEGK